MTTTKDERKFGFSTRQLHAAQIPDPTTGSMSLPIYQTTAFAFQSTDHAARLFSLEETGNIYTRIMNPTSDVFEKRLADLEGGSGGLSASSGHAAQAMVILALCNAGDHIVASQSLYGGTISQFAYTFPRIGIETTFVDSSDPENFRKAIRPNTKLIWGETLGNPSINVFPFEKVSQIAKDHQIPVVIDNTFASPYLCRPIEWGADIVVHSTTKFICGHGTTMGGAIVDGGKFDWSASPRFPDFQTPDPSYHGLVYAEPGTDSLHHKSKSSNVYVIWVLANRHLIHGYCYRGWRRLSLRMERHVTMLKRLQNIWSMHEKVSWVTFPGLKSHPDYELSKRYLPKGPGAVLGFGVKSGLQGGKSFIDHLKAVYSPGKFRRFEKPGYSPCQHNA